MIFSSAVFLFIFLPVTLLLYYLANDKYKNNILLVASLLFYAYGEPQYVFLMMFSIVMNWALALLIVQFREKHKKRLSGAILSVIVMANLLILFVFKYLDFSITISNRLLNTSFRLRKIALPIGISFFTFQAMSYVIDVYRNQGKVQRNVLNVGLYIALFPQLIAGPIVRYNTIARQIENREVTIDSFGAGAKRFILGFCKKVILANNLSVVAEKIFGYQDYSSLPIGYAWIGAVCFALQIFYDFSGYSDMAIGLGKMFGFEFQENFNYPYIAKSVTDFWRRWHISLSQWFRDYIYIPLGGSRCSIPRHIFNLFVVWALTGLWHGANYTFIVWGLIYFASLVIEKYIVKPDQRTNVLMKAGWQCITLLIVLFAWVFFNSSNLSRGLEYCLAMCGTFGNALWSDELVFCIQNHAVYMIGGIVFAAPVAGILKNKLCKNAKVAMVSEYALSIIYMFLFIWAVSFIVLGSHNPFIYFNF